MTPKQQDIIDAATEVAHFSKTHEWPEWGTPECFAFSEKLDRLATAINAEHPNFNRNVRMGGANIPNHQRAENVGGQK